MCHEIDTKDGWELTLVQIYLFNKETLDYIL